MHSSLTGSRQSRKAQGFKSVKMNATEDLVWSDPPSALSATVERLRAIKEAGLDAGLDFHGPVHKPIPKQLAKLWNLTSLCSLKSCCSRSILRVLSNYPL
jgi:galactonate dehydratase